jgi:CBS domain-containing protein
MTRDAAFISEHASIEDAAKAVAESKSNVFLVGERNHVAGIITRKTIEEALAAGGAAQRAGSLALRDFNYLYADQPLELALERFDAGSEILPVFSRRGNRRLEGIITIETILEFVQKEPA